MAVGAFMMLTQTAYSVPNFARQTGLSCADCHSSVPKLNSAGRDFLLNGYVAESEEDAAASKKKKNVLSKDAVGLFARLRPFTKANTATAFSMPVVNRLAVIVAGTTNESKAGHISYFSPIEMDNNGTPAPAFFTIGLHKSPELNILFGNRTLASLDPFQSITNEGRGTIGDREQIAAYGSDTNKNNIAVTGLVNKTIYYGVSYAADKNDNAGGTDLGNSIAARGAVIIPGGFVVGAYYETGKESSNTFTRTMIDGVYEKGPLVINGAYTLDKTSGVENNGYYVEGAYTAGSFVPTVRYDSFASAGTITKLTGCLVYLYDVNVKISGEYATELTSPVALNNKMTVQVGLGI